VRTERVRCRGCQAPAVPFFVFCIRAFSFLSILLVFHFYIVFLPRSHSFSGLASNDADIEHLITGLILGLSVHISGMCSTNHKQGVRPSASQALTERRARPQDSRIILSQKLFDVLPPCGRSFPVPSTTVSPFRPHMSGIVRRTRGRRPTGHYVFRVPLTILQSPTTASVLLNVSQPAQADSSV